MTDPRAEIERLRERIARALWSSEPPYEGFLWDEAEIIDVLDPTQLRAFAHHQNRLVQRLLTEREGHLRSVEAAFTRRHNQQQKQITALERIVEKQNNTIAALSRRKTA